MLQLKVDNGGRCDLRVSFILSVLQFFSRTFAGAINKNSLSRVAKCIQHVKMVVKHNMINKQNGFDQLETNIKHVNNFSQLTARHGTQPQNVHS